jgi:hypothetical protein
MRPFVYFVLLVIATTSASAQDKVEYAPNKAATRKSTAALQIGDDDRGQAKFRSQCLAVVGQESFCICLARQMPSGLGFEQYVVILSKTKEENGYDNLGKNMKRAYDSIPEARDKCAVVQASAP